MVAVPVGPFVVPMFIELDGMDIFEALSLCRGVELLCVVLYRGVESCRCSVVSIV
jgi:hypothetical protein